jgi:methylmalonyl-CoA/ethylmalonyl-CoA epimerase
MSAIGDLLAPIGAGFFQQAYVVDDVAAAAEAMQATLGCTPFNRLGAMDLDYDVRGATVSAALALGFARSGNVQVELIEPVRGRTLHAEFLESNGPGVHHLGFLVADIGAEIARAAPLGFPQIMSGQFGNLRFCYLDTWDAFGLYTELVYDPDGAMMQLAAWR